MIRFIELSNDALFCYFLISNLIYLMLLVTALFTSTAHRRRLATLRLEWMKGSALTPPISLLVPAHNEEKWIASSVRALLALDYPELELLVVNDGSTDRTLAELTREFQLRRVNVLYIPAVRCAPVRGVYRSRNEPRLVVVDKEPGGSKADAVNAALNAASSPYIAVVDADSILEKDALLRIMVPVLADPQRVVATGGIVRVMNGSRLGHGELREVLLPRKPIEILQVIEYLRSFLVGREAWGRFNMLPIISGAFGLFRRDLVMRIGGYRPSAVGEDFDLVTRLHRHLQEQRADYRICFVADPICWTEAPGDLRSLSRQRIRWHKGLCDVLWQNRDMLFRPSYGRTGSVLLPYFWIYELLAPVVELVGYTTILLAALLGVLNRHFFLLFLIFGYLFATMISIGAVLQEEITYRRYNRWRDVTYLVCFCFLEHFPYRQLHMFWRLQGIWQYLRGNLAWGEITRVGSSIAPRAD